MTDTSSTKRSSLAHPTCRYWLAQETGQGNVRLVDGSHDSPEGVAKAAKLMQRIFRDDGPWLMVEIHAMPDIDVSINEEAAQAVGNLVAEWGP